MPNDNNFGNLIKQLRIRQKLTARQLADKLYVSQPTVTRWENGERLPDIHMLPRLAACLGVDPVDLLDKIETMENPPVVLVAEDEAIILRGVMNTLSNALPHGTQIFGFRTADSALEFAATSPVHIAFLDIQLGQKDGLTVAKELSRLHPRVNVIFLTAYADYMSDAWKLHASGFLLKPLEEDALQRELAALRYPVRGFGQ